MKTVNLASNLEHVKKAEEQLILARIHAGLYKRFSAVQEHQHNAGNALICFEKCVR